jgi:branched-subunit amino acid ABC-type transport system permease component
VIQVLQTGITESAVFVLLGTAFFLIYNVGKVLHFAHGTTYLLGAYAGYAVASQTTIVLALACAPLAGAIFGLGVERFVYQPLRRRGATAMILLIGSLAVFILIENVVAMVFGSRAIEIHSPLQQGIAGRGGITWIQLIAICSAVLWVGAITVVLARTSLGYYVRAMTGQLRLAELSGVPTHRVRLLIFLLASSAVGLAGFVRMVDINGSPSMDLTGTLYAIVPFIVGGSRSMWGTVIGAVLVGFGSSWAGYQFGNQWTEVFLFALLAVIVLTRPQGLFALGSR